MCITVNIICQFRVFIKSQLNQSVNVVGMRSVFRKGEFKSECHIIRTICT